VKRRVIGVKSLEGEGFGKYEIMNNIPEFINASAGTGKTTRLVVYFLYKLLQAKDPRKVIACTFTIAATNEFKSRVVDYLKKTDKELLQIFNNFDLKPIEIRGNKEKLIPILEIKTLDSFFLSLFSRNSNNTFYRIMNDFDSERIYQESYTRWIKKTEGFEDQRWREKLNSVVKKLEPYDIEESKALFDSCRFKNLNSFLKIKQDEIKDLFSEIKKNLPSEFKPTSRSNDYVKLIENAYFALDFSNLKTNRIKQELEKIEEFIGSRDFLDVEIMTKITKFKQLIKNYENYEFENHGDSHFFKKILELILIFKSNIKKERFFSSPFILRSLLKRLNSGLFDFECDHLFVDEFQDTNRFQGRILRMLKGHFNFNVTFVGDSKQAIYKFRDASSAAFFEVDRRVKDENKKVINRSFRSNRPILALTNWIFERFYGASKDWRLFSTDDSNAFLDSEKYPLTIWSCKIPEIKNANRGTWMKSGSTLQNLEQRAVDCVSWIRAENPDESILVLAKNWKSLGGIAKGLSSIGVNAVIAGSPNLMNKDDIDQDIIHIKQIFRCLINPSDKAILNSVLIGNSFAHNLKDIKNEKNIKKSLEIINKYSSRLYKGDSISSTLVDFLNETGYIYGIKGDTRSHERTLKIFEFLRNITLHEKSGHFKGFEDFLYWADSGFRTHSPPPGLEKPEPVFLRTSYGAKGLSADHVVIVSPDEQSKKTCFEDLEFEKMLPTTHPLRPNPIEISLKENGDLESMWFFFDEFKNPKKVWTSESFLKSWKKTSEEFYQEQINVNYVSMTRAKKTLHVVSNGFYHPHKLRKGDFLSAIYKPLLGNFKNSFESFSRCSFDEIDIPIPKEHLDDQGYSEESFVKYLLPEARRIKHAKRMIDESLLNEIAKERFSKKRAEDIGESDNGESNEVARGNSFHKVIEVFGPPVNKEVWVKDVLDSGIEEILELNSNKFQDFVFSFSERINQDQIWKSIKKDLITFWTEYQIKGSEKKEFQKIDLLIEKKDRFIIIDWKTGKRTKGKKDKYSEQVAHYRNVLSVFLSQNKIDKGVECYIAWVDEKNKIMERI